jgi:hypothetical protein
MWEPQPASSPPPGWWTELETATRREAAAAAELRAVRIEALRARAHEVDMKAAGALSADRWQRIQRRRSQRFLRSPI